MPLAGASFPINPSISHFGSTMNRGVFFYTFFRGGGKMVVQGEKYFLLISFVHLICLLCAKEVLCLPLKPGKAFLACLFAGGYSLLALLPNWPLQRIPFLIAGIIMTGVIAFGKSGFSASLPMLICGFCCGGIFRFFSLRQGGLIPAIAGGLCCLLFFCRKKPPLPLCALRITFQGKEVQLSAFYDTGNSLHHPLFRLPVIVAGEEALQPLLPTNFRAEDAATLPIGFTLLPCTTVHGRKMLPCFHPDEIRLLPEKRKIDALIALSPEKLPNALLPNTIIPKEAPLLWKRKPLTGKSPPPSVNG